MKKLVLILVAVLMFGCSPVGKVIEVKDGLPVIIEYNGKFYKSVNDLSLLKFYHLQVGQKIYFEKCIGSELVILHPEEKVGE